MSEQFVIDCSVVMSWCFQDEAGQYADAVLDSLQENTAAVPALWPLEVVNALLTSERRGRLAPAGSIRFLSMLARLPIVVDREWPERTMKELLALGRASELSSYDAAYLELAMRKGLPIATLDARLEAAAGRSGVALYLR